LELLLHGESGR